MSDDDLEKFYAHESKHDDTTSVQAQKVTKKSTKKSKKRKPDATDADAAAAAETKASEDDTLRKKARFYTKSAEQWKVISRYPPKRMEEFVQEKDFEAKKELEGNILDGVFSFVAGGIDTATRGDGHVQQQLMADVSLKNAIKQEGADFVQFFSNKVKILVLTFLDISNGKVNQRVNGPRRHGEPDVHEPRIEDASNNGDSRRGEEAADEAQAQGVEGVDLS